MPNCFKCLHEECDADLATLETCFAPKYCFTETRIREHQHGQLLVFKRGCEDPGPRAQLSTCHLFSATKPGVISDLHLSCCDTELCNKATFQTLALERPYSQMKALFTPFNSGILSLIILALVSVIIKKIYRNRKRKKDDDLELGDVRLRLNDDDSDMERRHKKKKDKKGKNNNEEDVTEGLQKDDIDLSSRGQEKTLSPRTISRDIKLGPPIGRGRYGTVYKATWKGTTVAVKSFMSIEYASFEHEKCIYESMSMFMSEYILNMIAADFASYDSYTHHWIITDYCPLGSLYDFLSANILTMDQAKKIIYSILRGFHLLHNFSDGKPLIAHRDIKSKNLLMSKPDKCVIADFGLAVACYPGRQLNVSANYKVGTKRYMAPEILNDSFNNRQFSSYLQADIYCISLLIWEIANRIERPNEQPKPFRLAYEGMVPQDPSFEEMKDVVATQRPPIDASLMVDAELSVIVKMIQEGWAGNPSSRPTIVFLRKRMETLLPTKL